VLPQPEDKKESLGTEEKATKESKEEAKGEEGEAASSGSNSAAASTTPRKKKKATAVVEEVSLDDSPPLRRSSRKKTPTKYAELIENELIRYEDDDLMEVQEIDDDDDSDIQEVEPEDPLGGSGGGNSTPSISITKATSSSISVSSAANRQKPNVVTIDDLKTLQRLATSAKKSVDDQKRESISILDTQSILAGKMGSGVSITPARPRGNALGGGATIITPAGLNISPAGLTLGSGVTIKPNTPKTTQLGSVTITSSGGGSNVGSPITAGSGSVANVVKYAGGSELSDPNLTDGTFVVEAPSFIVPYVYEKPPKETIKAFTESIAALQKEKDKKEAEEKARLKKEKDEERKKRREERAKRREAGEKVEEDTDDEPEVEEVEQLPKSDKENKEPEKKEEKKETEPNKDTYFSSTLGKFFIDLGMNLVQEFVQKDLLRQQMRRSQKDKSAAVIHAINSLQKNLDDSREQNELFHYQLKKCRFCSFRTESRIVLQNHLETPHMKNGVYRCNFCEYETKIPQEVLFHMDSVHGVKGKMERAPYFHQCPQCPFEDNGKGKLTRHKMGCDKRFKAEINQAAEREWDPPAKIRPTPVRPGYSAYMPGAGGTVAGGMAMGRGGVATFGMGSGGIRPGQSLLPGNRTFINNPRLQASNRAALAAARGRPVGSYKGPTDLRIPQPGLLQQQQQQQAAKLRGLNPQMMSGQQMLAILNQQGLTVSQVKLSSGPCKIQGA
jgi:hypothetical protein